MKCNSPLLMNKLEAALNKSDLTMLPSEFHGLMTGLVCGGIRLDKRGWQKSFLELANDGQPFSGELEQVMKDVYRCIDNGLSEDPEVPFQPLLPDEDEALSERLEALIEWIQSFFLGLARLQPSFNTVKGELGEMLGDLREITQVEFDVEDNQENAEGFSVLVDHVVDTCWKCLLEFGTLPGDKTLH
ncbi:MULTISPECIES: UPF0149 family protein [Ferrimonas]|uniref:UPF0149 family protein n=1 Tax=Ferrimonas TaxID=44011 RepID=UPI0003FD90EB|nr:MULTISPECIES: UPF0149 family protein [Ferrimonas]USD38105.1 UPF0149 family protein [Ferrimonas sp. SCSIO 43195]